ncbi:hypothetical protein BC829DRAFT_297956 [Chytridium lagenaria]|nr:hypothetical protein BC829DRAFT_297956 [Chytridium lagenaria]
MLQWGCLPVLIPSFHTFHAQPHSLVAGFPDAGGMVSAYRLTHPNVAQNLGFPSMALSSFHHLQAAQYAAAAAMQAGSMSGEMDSDPIDMEEGCTCRSISWRTKSIDWKALQDSVVGWSDVLEWYGLVDYENGFWETDILDLISVGVKKAEMASVRLNA